MAYFAATPIQTQGEKKECPAPPHPLSPNLSLFEASRYTHTIALVVGTVIGTGVFLKAGIMAEAWGRHIWCWGHGWSRD